jgi:hypothetical protein
MELLASLLLAKALQLEL